ncbi:9-O-acetylesterase [Bacteroidales bacterium OttesenSCG-928-I14]|nr:9-O-acetylesterase [Bacteroidales bacterium OttesenSCG-928-I14]
MKYHSFIKTRIIKKTILLACLISISFVAKAQLELIPLFTDHMVLQQKTEAPIWGKAKVNSEVKVLTSWDKKEYKVKADDKGKWMIKMTTPQAGGPFTLTVSSGREKVVLKDVLIGEVWLCSGQSNMEWRVDGALNPEIEKENAQYPSIRMLTAEKRTSMQPIDKLEAEEGGWVVCSPATVLRFSAAAYFFGRNLHQSLGVPIGLINSSWGGTVAEAWTSGESLSEMPYFKSQVDYMNSMTGNKEHQELMYQQQFSKWQEDLRSLDPGFEKKQALWASPKFGNNDWDSFEVPGMIQDRGYTQKNGLFWFRKEIDIPQSWAGKEVNLVLGVLDDDDFTYFNGVQVGHTEGWMSHRSYKVPAGLVKAGKAVIAVRLLDTGGSGGFSSAKEDIYLESSEGKINISGEWKLKTGLQLSAFPPVPKRLNGGEPNHPTVLYNAMIAPLVPYAIKGAIWYQGEANTGRAYQYRDLLPLMITDWRKQFNQDLSFYIVELANFTRLQTEPTESTWAELREAQQMATRLSNTGIACLIDIGEAENIHPRNKQDVGLRLALNARAKTYGEKMVYSGPVYDSYVVEGNTIRIRFKHTDGGLKTRNNEEVKGFTIAGPDHKFYWAKAVIEGDEIVVSSSEVGFPLAVRYAWADNPICNLYNGENLPALPFRTDDWQGITAGN